MNKGYIPTTNEVINYIRHTHRKHMTAAQKDYEKWVSENPPKPLKKKYIKKTKPIKKEEGEIILDFT